MKKPVIFAACFLLCGSFLYAELTRAQLWAISLTGIMTEANSSYRNSLNAFAMNESGADTSLRILNRDWGIYTREELFETLDRLEDGGHPAALREIKRIIYECIKAGNDGSAISAILNKVQWDQVKINRFNYVNRNWEKYQNVTLQGWDLGRGVSLCRWGYNAGFITESEAWKRIFRIAELVQSLFSSWEEFGYDYYMGRLFWASSSGDEETYLERTEPIYRRLLNSYWSWLEWNIDLFAEEETVPIIPRRFSPPADNDGIVQYLTNDPAMYNQYTWYAVPNPNTDPNVYELRTKIISGCDNTIYGMIFCVDGLAGAGSNYYILYIHVDGRLVVFKMVGRTLAAMPFRWTYSSFLESGYGVYNRLRVEREDNRNGADFRIFINGNFVIDFHDDDPIDGVNFGPVVSNSRMETLQFPHIPVDIRFDY